MTCPQPFKLKLKPNRRFFSLSEDQLGRDLEKPGLVEGQEMEWDELLGGSQPNSFHDSKASLQYLGRREKSVASVPVPLEPRAETQ